MIRADRYWRFTAYEETIIIPENSTSKIAKRMGLMPLVAPFVAEQANQLKDIQKIYKQNYLTDTPTILVEGASDIIYLTSAIQNLSPKLTQKIDENELRIVCKEDGAGCGQLVDWVYAWIYSGFRSPMIALFDKDNAGIDARSRIISSETYKNRSQLSNIKISHIEPSDDIIEAYKLNIDIDFEIENLCSSTVWTKWKKENFIEEQSAEELMRLLHSFIPRNKTLDEFLDELKNNGIKNHVFLYKPKEKK